MLLVIVLQLHVKHFASRGTYLLICPISAIGTRISLLMNILPGYGYPGTRMYQVGAVGYGSYGYA